MSDKSVIKMGSLPPAFNDGLAKTITFVVTEGCNLACKYCYLTGKNNKRKMSYETATKAVDFFLLEENGVGEDAVVFDFIGGEPLLEIDLIDKVCDYIKMRMFELNHKWFNKYRISMATNGILYHTEKVQRFISKNKDHLSIGITIDGTKAKHDLMRVYPDGKGSYNDVVKNIALWQQQFPSATTKVTFAHDDLKYIKESVIHLWNMGLKIIPANVVFENVYQEGDDIIFENQLVELADYILENQLWSDYSVRFFSPLLGFPLSEDVKKLPYCGSGKMPAVDCDGNIYPCFRFLDFALENKSGIIIGNIFTEIDKDKLRRFEILSAETISKNECLECEVASQCGFCVAHCYDSAETDTIFQRATYICKMHKANVRANKYFWDKFSLITGKKSPRDIEKERLEMERKEKSEKQKYLQFIAHDNITPHCTYRNWRKTSNIMSKEILDEGLEFARQNNFIPVFLGDIEGYEGSDNIFVVDHTLNNVNEALITIYDNKFDDVKGKNTILLVSKENINRIYDYITKLYKNNIRINLVLENIETWRNKEIELYKEQLDKLTLFIVDVYKNEEFIEVNVLTDNLFLENTDNCEAGINSFSLAPNGKIYLCPAFYFEDENNYVGDINSGINITNNHLFYNEYAPLCKECESYHCKRCKYISKKMTNEYNIPSKNQCLISNTERNMSRKLQIELINSNKIISNRIIEEATYLDTLDKVKSQY